MLFLLNIRSMFSLIRWSTFQVAVSIYGESIPTKSLNHQTILDRVHCKTKTKWQVHAFAKIIIIFFPYMLNQRLSPHTLSLNIRRSEQIKWIKALSLFFYISEKYAIWLWKKKKIIMYALWNVYCIHFVSRHNIASTRPCFLLSSCCFYISIFIRRLLQFLFRLTWYIENCQFVCFGLVFLSHYTWV